MPFNDHRLRDKLVVEFEITQRGIPSLILLDTVENRIINANGVEALRSDPQGHQFPWRPVPVSSIIGDEFINAAGNFVSRDPSAQLAL